MNNEDERNVALKAYRDGLFSADEKIKLETAEKLLNIAVAVGAELTQTVLFGIIKDVVPELCFFDEVQLMLLQKLDAVVETLGGWQYAKDLMPVYEQLAGSEELVIRTIITESLVNICDHLSDEEIDTDIIGMIDRLVQKNWFTAKCTVAGLFTLCYQRGNAETKIYIRKKALEFCEEDNPLLRKTYAVCLNGLVRDFENDHLVNDVIPLYLRWNEHDQEQIRISSIDLALSLAYTLKEEQVEAHLISALQRSATDASWRVRKEMAAKLLDIQKALNPKHATVYVQMAKLLAMDSEFSTRETMSQDIIEFCLNLKRLKCEGYKEIIINDMIDVIRKMSQDTFEEVRCDLAETLMNLEVIFDKDEMRKHLLPIILTTLNMEPKKVLDTYVGNLNKIMSYIGYDNLGDDLERIMFDLLASSASRWRARRLLIVTIRIIAKHSDKEYFAKTIIPYYHKLLGDTVFSIRRTSPYILPLFIHKFGMAWTKQYVLHKVFYGRRHANYLYRMVVLFCIDELLHPSIKQHLIDLDDKPEFLIKMSYLSELLDYKLNEEWVTNVCTDSAYDFPEDAMAYTDNLLKSLEEQETGEDEKQPPDQHYMISLYCLLLKYVLAILKEMSEDAVPNVRSRCVRTLENLLYINHSVSKKLEDCKEILDKVTDEEKMSWRAEIDEERATVDEYMREEL
ncbi:PREDICTED: serine/threonine-protein phosphatase 2A 65 kDa regulatory subunit A beta isoform-like isoform X2 [Nicrophorus vespilloides]|uniref:Serine/threonine-protein phosphatase 2A 65 kDa regulatory subunit A beta isoform-like isoform X2 n=1 Tax=Nicrophorus vespilloides TaxID=110193 RepID=A0ABM1M9X5_NICVS|nr:PREDICTED: serine/threonine-protein phosphatase 2A 65 kDa regulatory subunit A beta isoform-like isoform X2 [Nicrophorus vespilloides]